MNEMQFKELEELRKCIKKNKEDLMNNRLFKSRLERERTDTINQLQDALRDKEIEYLNDKEAMKEKYGCTNDSQRRAKIKELTSKQRLTLDKFKRESQWVIDEIDKKIEGLKIKASDLRMQYEIRLEYYRNYEGPATIHLVPSDEVPLSEEQSSTLKQIMEGLDKAEVKK